MVDTLEKGEVPVVPDSKGKIFALLRAFPPAEPTRKRLVAEAVTWTARNGEFEHGDPELHDVAGKLHAEGT